MTREELQRAIEQIEIKLKDMELCVGLIKCGNQFIPKQSTPLMDAMRTALTALRSELDRVDPQPLSLEQLRERANKPYWHKSLTGRESKWGILPDHIAARPEDYHYGERWLAYDNQPKEEHDD